MQSRRNIWRSACRGSNAYNPVLALRATFGTSANCLKHDGHIPSSSAAPKTQPSNPAEHNHKSIAVSEKASAGQDGNNSKPEDPSQRANNRESRTQRNPKNERTILKPGERSRNMQASVHKGHEKHADQFARSPYWKQHMVAVREESFKYQNSQWRDKERSVFLQRKKRFLDYDAKIVRPRRSGTPTSLSIPWANDESERKGASVNACLTRDITSFAAWAMPTRAEQRGRTEVVRETIELIRSVLPEASTGVELFGSEKNGLALPYSDIDLRIYDMKDPDMPHARLYSRLTVICEAMQHSEQYILASVRNSNFPILNCQHRASGVDIQIVASRDSTQQQALVAKYLHQVPQLRQVYFVVRTILSMRGLVDVYTGGLGSYGTFVMVLAVLHRHMEARKKTRGWNGKISSGTQLIAFFEFYRNLDTKKHGVAVHPRTLFKKHAKPMDDLKVLSTSAEKRGDMVRAGQWQLCVQRPFQPYLLCLQDPADPLNDLGRRCHAIKHIFATLTHLSEALATGCLALKKWKDLDEDGPSGLQPLLLPLVGQCHNVYHRRRKSLEGYGIRKLEDKSALEDDPLAKSVVRRYTTNTTKAYSKQWWLAFTSA